jgi:hypothetical protein
MATAPSGTIMIARLSAPRRIPLAVCILILQRASRAWVNRGRDAESAGMVASRVWLGVTFHWDDGLREEWQRALNWRR